MFQILFGMATLASAAFMTNLIPALGERGIQPTTAAIHASETGRRVERLPGRIEGPIVPWDDILHEGPVPLGLNPAAMRERRAEFLAACGWAPSRTILRMLEERHDQFVAESDQDDLPTGPLPTADELADEVERFLREQG